MNQPRGAPDLTLLDRAANSLQPALVGGACQNDNRAAIKTVPLYGNSIPDAVLDYARQESTEAIVIGASRAGILQQVVNGNIPAAISQSSDRTVILVRGSRA